MAFDGIVTRAVSLELSRYLSGGKVEKIYQPERDELVFFVHGPLGRVRFYTSSSSEHCGIYMTDEDYRNPAAPPALCMLMRKHLQGSRIVDIRQTGSDRMIEMFFESRDEMGFTVDKKLIIEIMGRHSNIILVEKETGRILGAVKHITGEESRARQILPGGTYEYPPSQDKIPFDRVTKEDISGFIDDSRDVSKALLDNISGISPVMARYLAYGGGEPSADDTAGDSDAGLWRPDAESIASRLAYVLEKIESGDLETRVYIKENGTPADFSVVKIPEYEERYSCVETSSVSEAIAYYYRNRNTSNRVRQKSQALSKTVTAALKKARLKKQRLSEDILTARDSEKFRLYGELLTANLHLIKTGDKEAHVTNYYNGEPISIPLDVRYAPAKNAQIYFKKYSKSKTALIEKQRQLEQTDTDITYLESVSSFIENASAVEDLDDIRAELIEQGYVRARKQKGRAQKPKMRFIEYRSSGGHRILVGRNNKENDQLTLKKAARTDIWFHTKDIPGSHVILFPEGREVDDASMLEAANIAAWHSKARTSSNVPVDYTEVRHVKKPSGAKPGMVIFTDNRTLYMTPKDPSDLKV